jgi:hypothetical protein
MLKGLSPGAYHKRLWLPLTVIAALGILGIVLYFALSNPTGG